jgi:hypothetical protein
LPTIFRLHPKNSLGLWNPILDGVKAKESWVIWLDRVSPDAGIEKQIGSVDKAMNRLGDVS